MKQLILLCLSFSILYASASNADSSFQRHQLNFSMTNAVSFGVVPVSDFGTNDVVSMTPYYPYDRHAPVGAAENLNPTTIDIPNYSMHLRLEYSLGLSRKIRLESGLGYLMQGMTIKYTLPATYYAESSLSVVYINQLTIPLHVKFSTKTHKGGTITCTFGPDFNFPFQNTYRTGDVYIAGVKQSSQSGHQRFNNLADNSNLGFDLKLGWEKKINSGLSINFGPVLYITQLYWLHYSKMSADQQIPPSFLQSYIGFDVALNLGVDGLRLVTKNHK